MAFVTDSGWPPTGAHREIDRLLISNERFLSAGVSFTDAQHVRLPGGEPA